MSRYWVYLNDAVSGPYGVDQLIRLRGFSRQTLVCVEEAAGKPEHWISPAQIPELAHIFQAADEHHAAPTSPAPKPAPKAQAPRPQRAYTPAVTLKTAKRSKVPLLIGLVLLLGVLSSAAYIWSTSQRRHEQDHDRETARALIENVHLPAPSPYGSLPQYFQEKEVRPKWAFDKKQENLYDVTLSWYTPSAAKTAPALSVYAFEVNLMAQTVRGINTAASKLLSEGFPASNTSKAKATPAPVKKKSPAESFAGTLESERAAAEAGDFEAVWNSFSPRKKAEMSKAGISHDGFVRLQGLTHKVESGAKITVLKTKQDSDTDMLALVKQSKPGKPDVFIKQFWIYEDETWKLDDEQKKSAGAAANAQEAAPAKQPETIKLGPVPTSFGNFKTSSSPAAADAPAAVQKPAPDAAPKPAPAALPGMSN